ncbi:hypothetical protein [Demequina lutea]|uniref:Adenosine deaminase n=1 Tax=Demequina lutea TaxID=431489 RepID=A0A7Z0CJH8_9MICO|nr:hypothetical protein [Demequina lutea]NYI40918.1 adenosine deaminase [Demequina lutea]
MDSLDYLRLLPKTELHCHFVSTMSAARLIALAEREGVALPPTSSPPVRTLSGSPTTG